MEGLRILSQKVQHTACKWQNQDRSPGLPPVIVPDAVRDPGPYTVLGVYLPGIPSLEKITGTGFHTRQDVIHA